MITEQDYENFLNSLKEWRELREQSMKDWRFMNSKDFKFEMVKNKYYWISVKEKSFTGVFEYDKVINVHPFTWRHQQRVQYLPERQFLILNWKEITKEEYDLFN